MNNPPQARHPGSGRGILYVTVILTGCVIMMIEILGTRIIGPFFTVASSGPVPGRGASHF